MTNPKKKDTLMDIMAEYEAEKEKQEKVEKIEPVHEPPNPLLSVDVTTSLGYDAFLDAMIDHTYFLYPNLRNIPREAFLQNLKQTYSVEQVSQLQKLMQQEATGEGEMDPEKQLEAGIRIARPDLADKPEELENIKRITTMMQMQSQMAMQQGQTPPPPGHFQPQPPQS